MPLRSSLQNNLTLNTMQSLYYCIQRFYRDFYMYIKKCCIQLFGHMQHSYYFTYMEYGLLTLLYNTLCGHSICLGFHHFSHFQVLLSPTCRLLFSDNCVLFNLSPVYLPKNGSNSLSNSFFSKASFLLFSCCYLH